MNEYTIKISPKIKKWLVKKIKIGVIKIKIIPKIFLNFDLNKTPSIHKKNPKNIEMILGIKFIL